MVPVHFSLQQGGHLAVLRYLLEQGADKNKATVHGVTPLHVAAMQGHAEVLSYLMRSGASLNARQVGDALPIDVATNDEIKQLIRDEEKRRRTPW